MAFITEAVVEEALLGQLAGLGFTCLNDTVTGPDGSAPEREAHSDTLLLGRLRAAASRLNPHVPSEAREEAVKKIIAAERPSLVEENRRLHQALVEGVKVEFRADDGTIRGDSVRLVDFDDPEANDWLALNQFTVIENGAKRRPDVV